MFQIFPFIIFFRLLRKLFYFFLTFSFFSDFFFRFTGFHRQAWGYSISCTPSSIIMFDLFNFNAPSYKASIVFQDFLLLHLFDFFFIKVYLFTHYFTPGPVIHEELKGLWFLDSWEFTRNTPQKWYWCMRFSSQVIDYFS